MRTHFRTYWRIAAVGLLGGIVAFIGSFVISPKYESSTRILLRGRDTTLLSATGEALRDQTFIADPSLTAALADTQAALISSRTVGEIVVDHLGLDEVSSDGGNSVADAVKTVLRWTKAILTSGFYAEPDPHDAAVNEVLENLVARPVQDSYVIEVVAGAGDADLAAAIANAGADALVTVSRERFRAEAAAYADFLETQVALADIEQRVAAEELQVFREQSGEESELRRLELQYTITSERYAALNQQYAAASLNAQSEQGELTRLDEAPVPTYPVSPKRYLYLGMGGIAGAVLGLVWTARRREEDGDGEIPGGGGTAAAGRGRLGRFESFAGWEVE